MSNIHKMYKSSNDFDRQSIEESIILHLDIYKKVLIKVVDDLPNELYRNLEAKRIAVMEIDKKLKIENLLAVHPVNSKEEIDELISKENRSVFISGN